MVTPYYSLWSCSLWSRSTPPCGCVLLLLVVTFCSSLWSHFVVLLVVTFYYSSWSCSLWSWSIIPYDLVPCGRVLLLLMVLLLVVTFCYSLWSYSLWSCSTTCCGRILLFLVVALYYSLWLRSIACGRTLLFLVVTFCCSLQSCLARLYLSPLFVVVLYYSSWLHFMCYFCDRIMDYDGKIIFSIEAPLIMEFCTYVFYLPSASTSHVDKFASTSCSKLRALFANNWDY